jgi:DNA-binding XRE family transcriptional regulator
MCSHGSEMTAQPVYFACLLRRLCRLGLRRFCFFSGCLWAPPSKCASGIAKPTDKIQDSTPWSGLPDRGGAGIRARVLRSEGAHRKIFINVVVLSILSYPRRIGGMETTELRTARRFLGLTQKQMADYLGCSPNHYSQLERGARMVTPQLIRQVRFLVLLAEMVLISGFYMVKRDHG